MTDDTAQMALAAALAALFRPLFTVLERKGTWEGTPDDLLALIDPGKAFFPDGESTLGAFPSVVFGLLMSEGTEVVLKREGGVLRIKISTSPAESQ